MAPFHAKDHPVNVREREGGAAGLLNIKGEKQGTCQKSPLSFEKRALFAFLHRKKEKGDSPTIGWEERRKRNVSPGGKGAELLRKGWNPRKEKTSRV